MVIRTKRQARAVIGTNWRGRTRREDERVMVTSGKISSTARCSGGCHIGEDILDGRICKTGKGPGGRTRPLRCFAIRGLSSDSRALRDVEVIRSSISSLMSMALLAWVHDFRLLGLHNIFCRMAVVLAESRIWCKKVPFFTPTE